MKNIKTTFWLFLIITSILWLTTYPYLPSPFNYFALRDIANQYSGIIAMGSMSLCMLLATRPSWLEKPLNGLDKLYRLHKWLGITALIATLTHYWFTKGKKWLVGLGLVTRPEKKRLPIDPNAPFSLEHWFNGFRGIAEDFGEWAFYLALVLMAISLVKRIPYHWFKKTHKLLAVSYLALVFHSVILIKFAYWSQPIGWLMAILLLAGSYSAFIILFRGIDSQKRYMGKITKFEALTDMRSYAVTISVPKWQGHKAGQFAFIQADNESHPFTIASSWNKDQPDLHFVIKQLGDYTNTLSTHFYVGQEVAIIGPYGTFTFNQTNKAQVWIGTGIGITPFIAKLEERITTQETSKVDLYYCYSEANEDFIEMLQTKAQQAQVQLHLWYSKTQGHLTAAQIAEKSTGLANSSIWFCGNTTFAEQLKIALTPFGVTSKHFHQELFEMR